MQLVERLSVLNSRHVVSTSRLAGLEIESLSAADVRANAVPPPDGAVAGDEGERAEREAADGESIERRQRALEDERRALDRERAVIERELRDIDDRLAALARTDDDGEPENTG